MMFLNLMVSATLLGTLLTTTEAAKPGNVIRVPLREPLRERTSFAGADGTLGRENTVHPRMKAVNRRAADVYQLPDMNNCIILRLGGQHQRRNATTTIFGQL
ncbi:hypothetical protein OH76DRAFT_79354 [Lentinus brumalis]|uniref:Uncharacterized protein n=1 Tax=Lentinus brumalis TaxID=2498619 RepID=A0A371DKY5_9APHY|nr:hypothetical protein OH76DRAFT_79354 [Polyporus brumalis]